MNKPRAGPRRLLRWALLAISTAGISSVLLFALFDLFPGLIQPLGLEEIRHFGMRSRYLPDPELVLVPRRVGYTLRGRSRGDQYSPRLGVEVPWLEFEHSFNDLGFRANSGDPPYHAMLIGDSFVASGESDEDTLSELLRAESGLSTFNLGTGWYGPEQYLKLFRRFGPEVQPTHAIFCFFAGNDIEDLRQYERWRQGKSYYGFSLIEQGLPRRYWNFFHDIGGFLLRRVPGELKDRIAPPDWEKRRRDDQRNGRVQLGADTALVHFAYLPERTHVGQLLASEEWQRLRSILEEFSSLAAELEVHLLVLYIPTKYQVYEPFLTEGTSAMLRELAREQPKSTLAPNEALWRITSDLELETIDLLPLFREATGRGELLYHPFDSHWNAAGRQRAAEHIAARLGGLAF